MNNFSKVGAELKLGLVEMQLYAFFLEYNFADRNNDKNLQKATQVKYAKEIAKILNFEVPEEYGMVDTDTEYGLQPMPTLSDRVIKEGEIL